MSDKSQQTRTSNEKAQEQWRYAGNVRRPSSRQSCYPADTSNRSARQVNIACTKHEKEKIKMQATIEKLQEAFCDKESKLQDTKSQLVRERRMSEILERQLKNARNLSEQLGRIIHDREQEIRTLKNLLNKRQDTKNLSEAAVQAAMLKASRRKSTSTKEDFQGSMRRSSSTSDHADCPSLSTTSVDKMLKEVHSLIDGLKIKDEAIKGLQEECTRRLDKIQVLQRSIQILQDQLTQTSQHHTNICLEKDNMISQLQHSLKESEETVQSLLNEKTKVAIEGENTIQELQEVIQQKDLMIKRIQSQLEEVLDTKETEIMQLRDALDVRQRDLETKQRDLEVAHEELFRSQMEGEALKMELNQEKCSLNRMSEEINSLVDKLTTAVEEMEITKLEYHKKDERLKHTQMKIQEMFMSFLEDHGMAEKLQTFCKNRREYTGRKVMSEEDIFEQIINPPIKFTNSKPENKSIRNSVIGLSNQQIHKQQLAELQQQVNDSQAVCGILQEQLKEVTDFLDQLLHIEISHKNMPALSLIKHYGKHLKAPHTMSKERIAPDGVSSNSQLDIECRRQESVILEDSTTVSNIPQDDIPPYAFENRSYDNVSYNHNRDTYDNTRSVSADELKESNMNTLSTDTGVIQVSVQGASSDSDEIILLLDDAKGRKRPASPPFPRGLKITENYGSDGSINTRENSSNVIERSVSFGSFSDSVLMSYDQSEKASDENSEEDGKTRCLRSIDMMDLIPVERRIPTLLSSDSDIWSEPDTAISRNRMGLRVSETSRSSEYSITTSSEHVKKKQCEPRKRTHKNILRIPIKKTATTIKRWLDRLKNYLRMFEETNFHLTDELNNICDVRNQMTTYMESDDKGESSEAILMDLSEYIRLNFQMQKKLEKAIHFNRQLIDVFLKNIACQRNLNSEEPPSTPKKLPNKHVSRDKRQWLEDIPPPPKEIAPVVEENKPYEANDIQSQLIGYHATLLSCQDMIKDLHSQLKERHCSEMMNKQALNKTVYSYLEDIDHCIDDLCKKMENSTGDSPSQSYSFKSIFGNAAAPNEEDSVYENQPVYTNPLMDKLKENEERLLRFEVLLNDKEQQLKLSAENALQLEIQLTSIKQSLYDIQMENLELKECLELSENKQIEMEDSSNQMLRELQMTMQRLADLEERFRCLNEEQFSTQKDTAKPLYPVQYNFQNGDTWEGVEETVDASDNIPAPERSNTSYSRDWESEHY